MRAWSPAAEDKLRALYATTPLPRLAFLLKRTPVAVKSRARVLGLRKGGRIAWTRTMDAQLRKLYPDNTTAGVAATMGLREAQVYTRANVLGLHKSAAYHASDLSTRIKRGQQSPAIRATQFKPGHAPANKGLRRPGWSPGRMATTQFKKGQMSGAAQAKYVPIGTERIDAKRGVVIRKLSDDQSVYPAARWRPVHVLVWEAAHGPVPVGLVCAFRPGMKTTDSARITVDRLELVSRAELMRRNTRHRFPPELNQLLALKAALTRKIKHRTKRAGEAQP